MSTKSHNFLDEENAERQPELRKNDIRENIVAQMNDALMGIHDQLLMARKDLLEYPAIFLFGLPRAGTTLLMQLFTLRFDVGYINNLIARFWRTPLYGIALSEEIMGGSKHSCFNSNYGKTSELTGPHEFAYFWHHWFNINELEGIDLNKIQNSTNWDDLSLQILNMAHQFSKPIAFKGMWPAYAMIELLEVLPQSFFVYIKRSPEDIALSLYHARMAYYADPNRWWSMYPPEYDRVINKGWAEQIAGQVYYLTRCYEQQLAQIPENCQAILHYDELCEFPQKVMERLREKVYQHTGYEMKISQDIPDGFTVHHPDSKFEGADNLLAILRDYFGKEDSLK